jgi:hypothetical protein
MKVLIETFLRHSLFLLADFLQCTPFTGCWKNPQKAHVVSRLSEDFLQASLISRKNARTKAQ